MQSNPSVTVKTQIGTLILATSGVQLANGFFGTFFALRVALADFEGVVAGIVLSSYFAGFTLGAMFCKGIIERFGHIRVYAAFGGIVIAATAGMTLWNTPTAWSILRAVIGFGCAGLFVTTESWLSAKAQPGERGRVFSIYMVGCFAALALGQLLITTIDIETAAPFNIVIVLLAIALVLISMTRAEQPQIAETGSLPYGQLSRAAPAAVAGAILSGFITGSFYALFPAWMQGQNVERGTIGLFMLTAILGGLALQVPIGRISDRFDRRLVLAALGFAFMVTAVVLLHLPRMLGVVLPVAALLGGLMSTIYPVSVAHAHDRMPADNVVAVSGRLLLASGCGSVAGPLLGSSLVQYYSISGVLYMMAGAGLTLALISMTRVFTIAAPERQERPFDILAPQAAPLAPEHLVTTDAGTDTHDARSGLTPAAYGR